MEAKMTNRILAVDDDAMNLKLVTATLGREGYEVIAASSGKEALQKAVDENPDLILLDVMMPEMDGYQVCAHLRSMPKTAHIPIMMLTALSTVVEKVKGFDAGADDYLAKPFAGDELIAHVKVLLRRTPIGKSVETPSSSKVIAVFSLRGGVGVSTLAANLAAGLTQIWGESSVLVDLVLTAGQSALFFNLPFRRTWANLVPPQVEDIDEVFVNQVLLRHESKTLLLAASPRPEQSEALSGEKVTHVLTMLSRQYHYLVLDLPHDFQETTLAGLDAAQDILLVLSPEMASVRAAICALEVFESLNYSLDKVSLILNWTFQRNGLGKKEIEAALKRPINLVIPYAADPMVTAINLGRPLVFYEPNSQLGGLFEDMAFLFSKDGDKNIKPSTPSEAWQRIMRRSHQRKKK